MLQSLDPLSRARISCLASSVIYVGSLYLHPAFQGARNDPRIIKRRMVLVSVVTLLLLVGSPYAYSALFGAPRELSIAAYGLDLSLWDVARALALTMVLFAAPMVRIFRDPSLVSEIATIPGLRNYVVGPISEELVFRSVIIAAYLLAGASPKRIVLETPLFFGVAHIHHMWQSWADGATFVAALSSGVAHFIMTTIFGTYSAFLFVRLHSVWPAVAAHAFANLMGPPQSGGPLWYRRLLVGGLAGFAMGIRYFV